jgi:hypothetical protein
LIVFNLFIIYTNKIKNNKKYLKQILLTIVYLKKTNKLQYYFDILNNIYGKFKISLFESHQNHFVLFCVYKDILLNIEKQMNFIKKMKKIK